MALILLVVLKIVIYTLISSIIEKYRVNELETMEFERFFAGTNYYFLQISKIKVLQRNHAVKPKKLTQEQQLINYFDLDFMNYKYDGLVEQKGTTLLKSIFPDLLKEDIPKVKVNHFLSADAENAEGNFVPIVVEIVSEISKITRVFRGKLPVKLDPNLAGLFATVGSVGDFSFLNNFVHLEEASKLYCKV